VTIPPVGVGLVGAGAFGEFCLEAFAAMPEVKFVGIADIELDRARRLAERYGTRVYGSLDALLENPTLHIVALNTPPYLHAEQGLTALRAGKHLFCEKPLALTYEDGQQLIKAAEENRVLLTVDYVMRHNPFWSAAVRLAQSGVLGAVRHMDLANHAAGLALPDTHWFWDKALSGGIWIEHGVHFFDAFAWVAGHKGQVLSSTAYQRDDGKTDRVEALCRYRDAAAHFYHGFDQSGQSEQTTVRITFEQGYVTLQEWIPTALELLAVVDQDKWAHLLPGAQEFSALPDGRILAKAHAPEGKAAIYHRSIQDGMRNLIQAIDDPDVELCITGEHALASLQMAVAAQAMTEYP
jgi:predicted dehydrogenase